MPVGLQILNDNGIIQIDERFQNFSLLAKVPFSACTIGEGGFYPYGTHSIELHMCVSPDIQFNVNSGVTPPFIIAYTPNHPFLSTTFEVKHSKNGILKIAFFAYIPEDKASLAKMKQEHFIYVFCRGIKPSKKSNFEVFNADGEMVFSGDLPYMKVATFINEPIDFELTDRDKEYYTHLYQGRKSRFAMAKLGFHPYDSALFRTMVLDVTHCHFDD